MPLQLELQQYITRTASNLRGPYLVGQPIEILLYPTLYKGQLEIRPPDATAIVRLTAARAKTDQNEESTTASNMFREFFRNTGDPGIYTIRKFKTDNREDPELLAFNVPPEESALALADTAEMKQRLGSGSRIKIQEFGDFNWIKSRQAGQEIREMLLYLILFVLLCEQLLAIRLSYHLNRIQPRSKSEKSRRTVNPAIRAVSTAAISHAATDRSEQPVTGGRA